MAPALARARKVHLRPLGRLDRVSSVDYAPQILRIQPPQQDKTPRIPLLHPRTADRHEKARPSESPVQEMIVGGTAFGAFLVVLASFALVFWGWPLSRILLDISGRVACRSHARLVCFTSHSYARVLSRAVPHALLVRARVSLPHDTRCSQRPSLRVASLRWVQRHRASVTLHVASRFAALVRGSGRTFTCTFAYGSHSHLRLRCLHRVNSPFFLLSSFPSLFLSVRHRFDRQFRLGIGTSENRSPLSKSIVFAPRIPALCLRSRHLKRR
ncbi:hypothetical protein B0H12DRAFT_691742 [Mycena haematopus]|nr:hypothetical protein B0H12DRAFT_691742 [Mycena haematopus]